MTTQSIITHARRYLPLQYNAALLNDLERRFGNILYVPMDVEPILPKDPVAFRAWFNERAKTIGKVKADIAGPAYRAATTFKSISSPTTRNEIWEVNPHSIAEAFPELIIGMQKLPMVTDYWEMWSSTMQINPHRDAGPWEDIPSSFRIKLIDDNVVETLYLQEDPPLLEGVKDPYLMPKALKKSASNVFAWNNVRAMHGSTFAGKQKVLLIMRNPVLDLPRYAELLERSVARFPNEIIRGIMPRSRFY
jgi:hypothetical protein